MLIAPKFTRKTPATLPGFPDKLDTALMRITGVCVLGMMMPLCDIAIVIVAQHTWIAAFDATPAAVAWTITVYTLALAAAMPLAGWAAARFGTKQLFLGSVAGFTLGSLLCAIAPNITLLIAFRLVQGLSSGILIPLVTIILTRQAGAKRLGRILAVLGVPMTLAPLLGFLLGGWLIDASGWPSIFWINLPIGLMVFALAAIVFPHDRPAHSETLDVMGMMLLSPALAALLCGVSLIPSYGTVTDPHVWMPAIIGLILFIAFVFHALYRTDHPLIDLRLFTNRVVAPANAATFLFYPASASVLLILPSYFQEVLHQTPWQAAMSMVPRALGPALTMTLAGALIDKRGPRNVLLAGIVLLAAGTGIFAYGVAKQVDYLPTLLAALTIMGLGAGCAIPSLSVAAMYALAQHQIARGSTLFNVNQQVAASLGTVLASVILTSQFNRKSISTEEIASAKHDFARHAVSIDASAIRQWGLNPEFSADLVHNFSHAYTIVVAVAAVLMALTAIPSAFLSKKLPAPPTNAAVAAGEGMSTAPREGPATGDDASSEGHMVNHQLS